MVDETEKVLESLPQAQMKTPPHRRRFLLPGCCGILCLAVLAMVLMVHRGTQATPSVPIPVNFIGEYSQNGGDWQPLSADTRMNALEGDLTLRGHFDFERDEVSVNVYLDNISMTFLSTTGQGTMIFG